MRIFNKYQNIIVFLICILQLVAVQTANAGLRAELIKGNLDWPVSIAFAGKNRIFVSLRYKGEIKILQDGKLLAEPFAKFDVVQLPETGLLGIAASPDFRKDRLIYFYYTYQSKEGEIFNRVAGLKDGDGKGTNFKIIIDKIPAAEFHNGGVIAFGRDKKLYITTGDATNKANAQNLGSLGGKVLRVNKDGSIPKDNPFKNSPVYSYGHRNIFGIAFDPKNMSPIVTENGPDSNDEINKILPGKNYGWPTVLGKSSSPKFKNPIFVFKNVVSPTGIAFNKGADLPLAWKGSALFGDWNLGDIHKIELTSGDRVKSHSIVFNAGSGVTDVKSSPEGYIYFTTQNAIYRLVQEKLPADGVREKRVTDDKRKNFIILVAVLAAFLALVLYLLIMRRPLKK